MIADLGYPRLLKSLKFETFHAKPYLYLNQAPTKISPKSYHKTNYFQSKTKNSKLLVHGYKYISKLTASGEETSRTLDKIHKSSTLKLVQNFEFDPYLCEDSCVRNLARALKRLKGTRKLNLIIRRVNKLNETNLLSPLLPRILRLKKLRLEFPGTTDIDHKGFIELGKSNAKCHSLKSINHQFINVGGTTCRSEREIFECYRKNIQLEEIINCCFIKKGIIKSDLPLEPINKPFRNIHLKRMSQKCGLSSAWALTNSDGEDAEAMDFFSLLSRSSNLEKLDLKSLGYRLASEEIAEFFNTFVIHKNLKHINFEMSNCRIGDAESLAMAFGVSKLPQLQSIAVKFIKSQMSGQGIMQLVMIFAKFQFLKKFSFFFSKFDLLEPMSVLAKNISMIPKIKCEHTKRSLYILKEE